MTGVQVRPIAETALQPIPRFWAGAMEFDFERGGITVEDCRYVGVRLSRQRADPPVELSLREALIRWSDPRLVEAVLRAEAPFKALELNFDGRSHLGGARFTGTRPQLVSSRWMDREYSNLRQAWEALVPDFQRRLEAGEFFLAGVQTSPVREQHRSLILSVWATDYEFDFNAGAVSGADRRYVAVRAFRTRPAGVALLGSNEAQPPLSTTDTGDVAKIRSRGRGRPGLPMVELAEIARDRIGIRRQSNKDEANAILEEFQVRCAGRKMPSHSMVSRHLEEIYAEARVAASSVNDVK